MNWASNVAYVLFKTYKHYQSATHINLCIISFKQNQIKQFIILHDFYKILVYTNKNKMAKYLQWKIICGKTTCKETLYKPKPHNAKIKNKLN